MTKSSDPYLMMRIASLNTSIGDGMECEFVESIEKIMLFCLTSSNQSDRPLC